MTASTKLASANAYSKEMLAGLQQGEGNHLHQMTADNLDGYRSELIRRIAGGEEITLHKVLDVTSVLKRVA